MSKPQIVVAGDSEQAVAFGLLQMLMREADAPRGRADILAAYRECLEAVRAAEPPPRPPAPQEKPQEKMEEMPEEEELPGEEDAAFSPPPPPRRRKRRVG